MTKKIVIQRDDIRWDELLDGLTIAEAVELLQTYPKNAELVVEWESYNLVHFFLEIPREERDIEYEIRKQKEREEAIKEEERKKMREAEEYQEYLKLKAKFGEGVTVEDNNKKIY
jgi:hypothetical protein